MPQTTLYLVDTAPDPTTCIFYFPDQNFARTIVAQLVPLALVGLEWLDQARFDLMLLLNSIEICVGLLNYILRKDTDSLKDFDQFIRVKLKDFDQFIRVNVNYII